MHSLSAPTPVSTTPHFIYLLFSTTYELLYIGETDNPARRFAQHQKDKKKPWWPEVANRQLIAVDNPKLAKAYEHDLIQERQPKYNIKGNEQQATSRPQQGAVSSTAPRTKPRLNTLDSCAAIVGRKMYRSDGWCTRSDLRDSLTAKHCRRMGVTRPQAIERAAELGYIRQVDQVRFERGPVLPPGVMHEDRGPQRLERMSLFEVGT
jgi:predicted GIY-YIG superfamily endonuclease